MDTLREQIEGHGVTYVLERCRVLLLEKGKDISKPMGDGTFIRESVPSLYVARANRGSNLTHSFNPDNPDHVEYVKVYDEWIEENPHKAKAKGFYKVGSDRPENFIQRWDDMNIEQIDAVIDAMQPDLLTAMQYELLRPEELGGPREEVVELLEQVHAEGSVSEIDAIDEVPVI